jgi:hypothetical protein
MNKFLCAVLFALLLLPAVVMADNITYTVNQTVTGGGSVNMAGTITTDGTQGTLVLANILSWDLSLTGDVTGAVQSSLPGSITLAGDALTADSTGLFFNYSGINSLLLFQTNLPSGGFQQAEWTQITGIDIVNGGTTPIYIYSEAETGNQMIASAPPAVATPEPGSLVLIVAGLAALLALRKLAAG